jgi:hypothetical protein
MEEEFMEIPSRGQGGSSNTGVKKLFGARGGKDGITVPETEAI